MRHRQRNSEKRAFTIVELLTVMGVIALLIGLLAPALNAVRRVARDTKQKAQFNSIKAGIEMFRADQGDYPESAVIDGTGQTGSLATGKVIAGSQRLAEALLGRDFQGFDPVSRWHPTLDTTAVTNAYGGLPPVAAELTKSLERRRSPYLDIENVGAFNIDQLYCVGSTGQSPPSTIYGTTNTTQPQNNDPAPLITDVYTDKTITVEYGTAGKSKYVRVGTPILYYKANTTYKDLQRQTPSLVKVESCTYNYYDNKVILDLGKMSAWNGGPAVLGEARYYPMANDTGIYEKFYESITNPQAPSLEGVAYRQDSYILMSAGRDGLFGTTDDIYNFGD